MVYYILVPKREPHPLGIISQNEKLSPQTP